MTDPDAPARLHANTAELGNFSTQAVNALASTDWPRYGHALGELAATVEQCMKDGLSLAPDPTVVQRAFDAVLGEADQ
jgi:hypothetical protein